MTTATGQTRLVGPRSIMDTDRVAGLPLARRYALGMVLLDSGPDMPAWTFLTNHAHVLLAIRRNPELRQRDISQQVGITIGAVQKILHDLEDGGFVRRVRVGRRNRYEVIADKPLRHPLEAQHTVEEILTTLEST